MSEARKIEMLAWPHLAASDTDAGFATPQRYPRSAVSFFRLLMEQLDPDKRGREFERLCRWYLKQRRRILGALQEHAAGVAGCAAYAPEASNISFLSNSR